MTAPSDASPARAKSSIADKLAALSGFGLVFAALSALGSGFENTADGYLRTISIAALCATTAAVSLALRAAEKDR